MSLYLGNTKIPGVKVTSSSISSLPPLSNPAAAGQMLAGYDAINASGNRFVGSINTLTESNITVNENTITIPAGYYATSITKTVEGGNGNLPTLTPTIKLTPSSNTGIITGSWSPAETGIVEAGTYSNTLQLSTQATKTVTPGTIRQTAVAQYKFTTGAVFVAGDSNLIAGNIKSGVSIFGVTGTYEGNSGSGSSNSASRTVSFSLWSAEEGTDPYDIEYYILNSSNYSGWYETVDYLSWQTAVDGQIETLNTGEILVISCGGIGGMSYYCGVQGGCIAIHDGYGHLYIIVNPDNEEDITVESAYAP